MTEEGWSVRRLAAALDVSPTTIQSWRAGATPVARWVSAELARLETERDPFISRQETT